MIVKIKDEKLACDRCDCFANVEGYCNALTLVEDRGQKCSFHKNKGQFYRERELVFKRLINRHRKDIISYYKEDLALWEHAMICRIVNKRRDKRR